MTSVPGYFGQAVSRNELGWPLVIVGCVGLLLMLRSETDRPVALGWIVFGLVLIGLFIAKPFQPFRNLLPLVPSFCIAAAFAFDRLLRWAARSGRAALWHPIAALVIGAIIVTFGFFFVRAAAKDEFPIETAAFGRSIGCRNAFGKAIACW